MLHPPRVDGPGGRCLGTRDGTHYKMRRINGFVKESVDWPDVGSQNVVGSGVAAQELLP